MVGGYGMAALAMSSAVFLFCANQTFPNVDNFWLLIGKFKKK